MSEPAELPQFFNLVLTPAEMKFVHALTSIQNTPYVASRARSIGMEVESNLQFATELMYTTARDDLGPAGINALYKKTEKLVAPLVFE